MFRKILMIALAVILVIGITGCAQEEPEPSIEAFVSATPGPTPEPTPEATPTPEPTYVPPSDISPTTGLQGTTTEYRPVVVQIDNEPGGRPQQGLQEADVVYETLIEDVATRFTCVFNDVIYSSPETLFALEGIVPAEDAQPAMDENGRIIVGPVRSSRYYHQWIASLWDPLYVHMGGPDSTGNAESDIWGESSKYIMQRINGAGKHPENSNMFIKHRSGVSLSAKAMVDLVADSALIDFTPVQLQQFMFYPEEAYADAPLVDTVKLSFLTSLGTVEYRYDAEKDKLLRYNSKGEPFITEETGQAVEVQNLIIQYTYVSIMPNDSPRRKVDMFGEGKAEFYIHGRHLTGTWSRPDPASPVQYFLDNGEEVILTPGNTWIAVHPDDKQVTTTYADGTESVTNPAE